MGRASKDKRDIYYRKAKEEGYRARSAYKLLQIHEDFNILNAHDITTGAVDLCAAPGSWCQVLSNHFKRIEAERKQTGSTSSTASVPGDATASTRGEAHSHDTRGPLKPRIVAVDLQEMAPVEGVRILQGDITSEATAREIIRLLNAESDEDESETTDVKERGCGQTSGGAQNEEAEEGGLHDTQTDTRASSSPSSSHLRKADIVVCDGAPDVTGMHELDEYLQHHLLLAALNITTFVLRPGGTFVTKMFRGPNTPFLVAKSELFFDQVRVVKPKSSRNASMECFLLCQNFRLPEGYNPHFTSSTADPNRTVHAAPDSSSIPHVDGGAQLTCDAPTYTYATSDNPTPCVNPRTGLSAAEKMLLPFLSCGDLSGFDADMCYDRPPEYDVLAPVQPPLQAPYLNFGVPSSAIAHETARDGAAVKRARKE